MRQTDFKKLHGKARRAEYKITLECSNGVCHYFIFILTFFNCQSSTKPFDRHDWVVDRCGKEVTYVLDFYQGKSTDNSLVSVYIDARPSPKSFEAIRDRFIRWFKEQ